jgi:hypothetical protein
MLNWSLRFNESICVYGLIIHNYYSFTAEIAESAEKTISSAGRARKKYLLAMQ